MTNLFSLLIKGNITQNWERHDVSTFECEQIFFNKPIIVKRDKTFDA